MKGHIRRRGKSSWAIILDVGRDQSGKRRQRWHTVRGSKRDAQRELARLVNEVHTGDYVEPTRTTFAEYLDRWLADYARPAVSTRTFERYEEIVRLHLKPALGGYGLAELRPLHIQGYYAIAPKRAANPRRRELSARTIMHIHRVLHEALKQAVRWQLLARNPADAVEPPRVQHREMTALDGADTRLLIQAARGTPMFMPVLLAVATGLRRGEILALRWTDVDFDSGTISVQQALEATKTGLAFKPPKTRRSRRLVALPPTAIFELRAHRLDQTKARLRLGAAYKDNGLVCPNADGSPLNPDTLSTAFSRFVRRARLPLVRFHDLRHTHATQLLHENVHPKIVCERLGHATIAITLDTYSHVLPGMQQEAAAKLDHVLRPDVDDAETA